jgi:general secretion pathway protein J
MLNQPQQRGFTLLELLVAITIFTIVGALAMGGLHQLIQQREMAAATMERIRNVQRCVMRMSQDFEQLAARPIRDATSSSDVPALYISNNGSDIVEFTHAGWSNPTGINRSTLQRVRYKIMDNKLYREYWNVIDRTLNNVPAQVQMLDKVSTVTLRYMDDNHNWQTTWPPNQLNSNGNSGAAAQELRHLPIAVEITITLQDWGEIKRLIEVPGVATL